MLEEQTQGLKFDIYERVSLSENNEGIQQLAEIELIPQIVLRAADSQAILKGNLLLKGTYTGVEDQRNHLSLEHEIPVEISLPKERIYDMEQVGVEIENFDVELLSSRSLNVTGVLSLQGVRTKEFLKSNVQDEEEEVFVHRLEDDSEQGELMEQASQAGFGEQTGTAEPLDDRADTELYLQESQAELQGSETESQGSTMQEFEGRDPEELKIHFSSQPSAEQELEDQSEEDKPFHREAEDAQIKKEYEEVRGAGKEAAWKDLFISRNADEPAFKKLRMCIVQKQDTLDTIAERYSMNPREIVLYNRLSEQDVTEGQVLYIPR